MKKIICVFSLISIILVGFAFAADPLFSVNGRDIKKGEEVVFTAEDLEEGFLIFEVTAGPSVNTIQISLDDGTSWSLMERDEDMEEFVYRYRPVDNRAIRPRFIAIDKDGGISGRLDPDVEIRYKSN